MTTALTDTIPTPRRGWHTEAKCRRMDPDRFDLHDKFPNGATTWGDADELETYRARVAAELCRGCSVIRECAADALSPLSIGVVRAGVWVPAYHDRHRRRRTKQLAAIARGARRG